jgi:hypothetical protein
MFELIWRAETLPHRQGGSGWGGGAPLFHLLMRAPQPQNSTGDICRSLQCYLVSRFADTRHAATVWTNTRHKCFPNAFFAILHRRTSVGFILRVEEMSRHVTSEVLTAVMPIYVLRCEAVYLGKYQCFGGKHCLHLQCKNVTIQDFKFSER